MDMFWLQGEVFCYVVKIFGYQWIKNVGCFDEFGNKWCVWVYIEIVWGIDLFNVFIIENCYMIGY